MKKSMWILLALIAILVLCGCGKFEVVQHNSPPTPPPVPPMAETLFPIASALVTINSYGDLAALQKKPSLMSLILPTAHAQVQASGVVSVTYSRPSATSFTLSTSSFMSGSYPNVSGDDLNMGNISINSLDDNTLRVCTGVGAPGNKCNRLYIRVFTLGSNIANTITGVPGFINVDATPAYGIDVLAGAVTTPIGFNSNQNATSVVDAATVFTYTIPGNMNRVRLSNTGPITFPMKADLSNAGNGLYEMRLVVQYALGYVP